ncbi:MAG: hypothetical protein P8Z80_09420 [Pseudolabrys sp.]|jgi:hypothetical protein
MSDAKTDARQYRADVSRYAPRRHRVSPDDAGMLPLLERRRCDRVGPGGGGGDSSAPMTTGAAFQ